MKIYVDGTCYNSKAYATKFFKEAMNACDGSEKERMEFAYYSILDGFDQINTYDGTAFSSKDKGDPLLALVKKIDKCGGLKREMHIFKMWEKSGRRTLSEIVESYIEDRFKVSKELAKQAAEKFI